tara:strand:+ start:2843 stop:4075 length:1233 start_codon:yes stop_codon:yes gene_type:complete
MLPISAVVGVSTIGYLMDQFLRDKNFLEENDVPIPIENINACSNTYPWNFVESFDNIQNKEEKVLNNFGPIQSNSKISSDTINFDIKKNNLPNINAMDHNLSIELEPNPLTPQSIIGPTPINAINNAGEPPTEYLINGTERPVEDFVVNSMVPFFSGTSTNQDMRGTGISQANVNSNNFNLNNDYRTPHNTTLSTFVGCDDTFMHKREVGNFFSPLEQRDLETIPGAKADAQRPVRDRYTTSLLTKNDEQPFEKIMVGPGLNIDYNMPNDGAGYNSGLGTQIKYANVGEYKLTHLPGRIAGQKYQYSNLPTSLPGIGNSFESTLNTKNNNNAWNSNNKNNNLQKSNNSDDNNMYGIKSNNKTPFYTLEDRPLTGGGGITQAPTYYSNFVFPSGTSKRITTNVSFGQSVKV